MAQWLNIQLASTGDSIWAPVHDPDIPLPIKLPDCGLGKQ